jgi:hypothetical protein
VLEATITKEGTIANLRVVSWLVLRGEQLEPVVEHLHELARRWVHRRQ